MKKKSAMDKIDEFIENYRILSSFVITLIVLHILTWFVIVCINIIIWKLWLISTYFIIERITLTVCLVLGAFAAWENS